MLRFVFCLSALVCSIPAGGQRVNFNDARVPIAELHGLARFQTGDDPNGELGWSAPNFDDSHWSLARIDQPWSVQGFKSGSGFAWYRFQIVVPPGHPQLGIHIPLVSGNYQIFMDGKLVGQYGTMPPHERTFFADVYVPPIHPIPDELIPAGRPVQVALRIWGWPYWTFAPAGLLRPLSIGDTQLLETQRDLRISDNLRKDSGWSILFMACLLGFFAGLILFLLHPGEFEYLWFASGELGLAAMGYWHTHSAAHPVEFHVFFFCSLLASLAFEICWPTFIVTFLSEPRRGLYWATVAAAIFHAFTYITFLYQWISASACVVLIYLAAIPPMVGMLLLIWIPARRRDLDARLLLAPQLLYFCCIEAQGVINIFEATGHFSLADSWQSRYDSFITWPFTFSVESLAYFIMQGAVLAIVLLRFARKSRDQERFAREIEAARVVQRVLVPEDNPAIPGFDIQAIYKPAGQVGGDFYQIFPTPAGGALIVIGDVSGKGMPAAMAVSLLVGTFRTLAESMDSPAAILNRMNHRMIGRSSGGFTTCLILRIDPDGTISAANAGHIAPYLNGEELPTQNGLPLGLDPHAAYTEATAQVAPHDRLTLLTDGVLEATNPTTKELFGFDRTAAISTRSAEAIAAAAQSHGQEDDITVLTLTFVGVCAAHP